MTFIANQNCFNLLSIALPIVLPATVDEEEYSASKFQLLPETLHLVSQLISQLTKTVFIFYRK